MIGRYMPAPTTSLAPVTRRPRLSVPRLGVTFSWFDPTLPGYDGANLEQGEAVGQRFRETVAEALGRQRRTHIEYWDAMTYLETVRLPEPLASTDEAEVCLELIWMLGRGHLRDRTVLELTRLPLLAAAKTRLRAYGEGLSDPIADSLTPRIGPGPKGGLKHDPSFKKGIYRSIDVDMEALGLNPQEIDWERLIVQAVLLQIHADLEMYYETGYLRVKKCQYGLCGAFFGTSPMDARSKFCSVTCRVASSRSKGGPARSAASERKAP